VKRTFALELDRYARPHARALIRQCVGVTYEQLLAALLRPATRAGKATASWPVAAMIASTELVVIGSLLVGWSGLVSLFGRRSQPRHRRKNRVPGQTQQKLAGEARSQALAAEEGIGGGSSAFKRRGVLRAGK
jgi:hypothetical protein